MGKTRKVPLVIFLILGQSLLAVFAGIAALYAASLRNVPAGVYAGEIRIGGMNYREAAITIEEGYRDLFRDKSLRLDVEGSQTFEIPFPDLGASVDGKATLQSLDPIKNMSNIPMFFNIHFGAAGAKVKPVVKLSESRLRSALMELAGEINKNPVDAMIYYEDGELKKRPDSPGVKLNVANTADLVMKRLSENPWEAVKLSRDDNYALQNIDASLTMKDLESIQQIIAEHSTFITDNVLSGGARIAVDAINGVILPAKGKDGKPGSFSFVECIKSIDPGFDNDNEGYDQVASTLYAALLKTGMPVDLITRIPHKLSVDYIEPGLDSWISGDGGDLKFVNPFDNKIAIFAEIKENKVTVAIAGSLRDKPGKCEIRTEIVQRFSPPVYHVENSSLKQGERIVLNPGKEGVMVKVYRNGEYLSTDTYEAEKAIIQVAPLSGSGSGDK